jgi:hypothetical protein
MGHKNTNGSKNIFLDKEYITSLLLMVFLGVTGLDLSYDQEAFAQSSTLILVILYALGVIITVLIIYKIIKSKEDTVSLTKISSIVQKIHKFRLSYIYLLPALSIPGLILYLFFNYTGVYMKFFAVVMILFSIVEAINIGTLPFKNILLKENVRITQKNINKILFIRKINSYMLFPIIGFCVTIFTFGIFTNNFMWTNLAIIIFLCFVDFVFFAVFLISLMYTNQEVGRLLDVVKLD